MIVEGRNDGTTSDGNEFRLQAFVVDEFDISELTASLTQSEQDLWTAGEVRASVFLGLIASEDTGYSTVLPVAGWVSSSSAYPDARVTITKIFDPEDGYAMASLWHYRAFPPEGVTERVQGDWEFWYDPCDLSGGSTILAEDPCVAILERCAEECDSNMRFAVAAYKAVWATAGTGCIAGGILTGAFCLVGALGCGAFAWVATRCAYVLGTATAALGTAIVASRIAYEMCAGACLGGPCGCP